MKRNKKIKVRERKPSLVGRIFQKLAPKIGARVVMEPEWNVVGQIAFRNGRNRYFRYSSLDLNPLGASEISKDKDYAKFFMDRLGYPTVPGRTFFSKALARTIGSRRDAQAARRYAHALGFPVIVKPNSGSQGRGVVLVRNKKELDRALHAVFEHDNVALIEQWVAGRDYRVVVLDRVVISVYERTPLNVVGNGRSTIRELLAKKQRQFVTDGRDTKLRIDDPRMRTVLREQGLGMNSRPEKGRRVYLLTNANLSSGGDSTDVTRTIHPEFKRIAIRLTKDMGLRLCGVDLMIQGNIAEKPGIYWILETNSAPGLDHYASTGRKQEKIVKKLYLKVLKSMEHA